MNEKEINFLLQKNIVVEQPLAKGAYGEVYSVYHNRYQMKFAMKKIPEKCFREAELECMKTTDDQRSVNVYQYFRFEGSVYLIMEFCPNDLFKMIHERKDISHRELERILYDTIMSVKACHDKRIAHCDIKPQNFLIDSYGRIKLSDFGLSAILEDSNAISDHKGTILFMAPEQLMQKHYNPFASDIWALGVTLFYIITKSFPFFDTSEPMLMRKILDGSWNTSLIPNSHLTKLVSRCLVVDPEQRATVSELLKSSYFPSLKLNSNNNKNGNQMLQKRKQFSSIIKPFSCRRQLICSRISPVSSSSLCLLAH
ncbi:CAMK family protein kinase [Trichomonas vaginalis G3]|uniref:CAMK family protein kinase n=1 Tax=Trichomonas vaginalis (strain ATCC PRA-98 / G3) TaxID=412133 RepID=A2DVW1_TRIV3|nr:protein serine/threonine kinase protein [Trichomonas vaginalis G3]EAY15406.1 CAMK family protein kinase [Trichomonas vaginalis G3]KAI5499631.1 protein serine/threonine kinase protein [Trichomonas vaginalis G3]|eukprot:XP_001327629.1 CAMK family protein kinase [Trichomonas vaginalis G3]